MTNLPHLLRINLADTFAFYLKTHFFHWNVTGEDFYEYHKLYQKIYEDSFDAVDSIAEHLRTLDEYAPGSFKRFSELTDIKDQLTVPENGHTMSSILLNDNNIVLKNLQKTSNVCKENNEIGIDNFICDRYDMHKKWHWMLSASLKIK